MPRYRILPLLAETEVFLLTTGRNVGGMCFQQYCAKSQQISDVGEKARHRQLLYVGASVW